LIKKFWRWSCLICWDRGRLSKWLFWYRWGWFKGKKTFGLL